MSATGVAGQIGRELRAICGGAHVVDDPEELKCLPVIGGLPAVAVAPGSTDEVAAILRFANQHDLAVIPAGGCTQQRMDDAEDAILLRTSRLSVIEHYDHADLTIGVGAGMTVAQLQALVGADRLLFACDPALPELATVGGVLATASHGPLRHGYGGVRDFCIGIRFVAGDGRVAKGGGRVVKNVAGYDLMKLLIGSHGTLAVITSASFKLFPAPRQTRTFVAEFPNHVGALKFRDAILRSPLSPMCLELVSPGARHRMRPEAPHSDAWIICVRAAGSDAVLARYRKELGSAVTREVDGEDETKLWREIADFPITELVPQDSNRTARLPVMTRFSIVVPPAEVGTVLAALNEITATGDVKVSIVGRVGVGHLACVAEVVSPQAGSAESLVVEPLLKRLPRDSSLWSSTAPNRRHATPTDVDSMRAVKRALDRNNVLNRGRLSS